MTILKFILLGLVFVALTGAAIVRVRPIDPAIWHVDPEIIATRGAPGRFSVAPGGDMEPVVAVQSTPSVAVRLRERITKTPRTTRLAGSLEDEGFATFVTRSKLWGFPDVTNIKLVADGEGTRIHVAARLVYGKLDMGVNEARVRDWLSALKD